MIIIMLIIIVIIMWVVIIIMLLIIILVRETCRVKPFGMTPYALKTAPGSPAGREAGRQTG